MLGLTEKALLFRKLGQRGGAPTYAEQGVACACRTEPAVVHSFSGNTVERTADTRIFLRGADVSPGDKIRVAERVYIVSEVRAMRAFGAVHHYEVLCKAVSGA